jgi:hypothetical protein
MILLFVSLTLGLGACAGTAEHNEAAESEELTYAEKYRRAIQADAERKNVNVHWINPPDDDDLDENDG